MAKIEIKVPSAGESVTEADIAGWIKKNGQMVSTDEELVELETDKASMPLVASAAGKLVITVQDGTVQVGDVIGYIDTDAKGDAPAPQAVAPVTPAPVAPKVAEAPKSNTYASGHPSPSASKELSAKGIDPASVTGTGKDGRITKTDAQNATPAPVASPQAPVAPEKPPLAPAGNRTIRREKMSRIRKTISKRLVEAQHSAALLTTFNEVDMSQVMAVRKQYKDAFKEKHGVGLGFMSFFSKAVSIALREIPVINAQVGEDEIIFHDYADIGIAVSTPRGLVVPIVRNVENLSLSQIESAILGYAKRGRDGKLTPEDMEGGTFTITNGGVFGSMLSTPIINRPQSAILGMHNIVERPVAINGEVKIRPIMYVALTYDHRIIDGSDAVTFLVKIKQLIEEPTRLLLDL
jgi:2-oxoglutarate dehydrogenase E2 component (dihydrolipoamide succinyltransferase)